MSESIRIPTTIEEMTSKLNGIERLLTAKGWERAAIVYAFTADQQGTQVGGRKKVSDRLGIEEFAELGIAGLASRPTVRKYRDLWAEHGTPCDPGDEVELPDLPFPPTGHSHGIADKIKADAPPEEKLEVLTTLINDPLIRQKIKHDPESIPELEDAIVDIASDSPRTMLRADVRYDEKHPRPEKPEKSITTFSTMAAFGAAAGVIVRARRSREDVELLVRWIEGYDLDDLDTASVRSESQSWRRAAELCLVYANQLAIAIGDETQAVESPVERMDANEIDSWIDSVLKGVS